MVTHSAAVWEQGIVCKVMLNLELSVFCLFNVINRLIDDMLIAMLIALRSGLKLVAAFVSVYVSTASVLLSSRFVNCTNIRIQGIF